MDKVLVIADDFTGALDTAIQFAKNGMPTLAYTSKEAFGEQVEQNVQVYVINAETRHLSPAEAYEQVRAICARTEKLGVRYIYKKTDSALRGNIGKELEAVMETAPGARLYFAPAYPQNERTTVNGVQYYMGTPVSETVYALDPFEPIDCSCIAEVIAKQSATPTKVVPAGADFSKVSAEAGRCILICDAETQSDLEHVCRQAVGHEKTALLAGCAGLAEQLANLLAPEEKQPLLLPKVDSLLIVSGSLNPISMQQFAYMEEKGYHCIQLSEDAELREGFAGTESYRRLIAQARKELDGRGIAILRTAGRTNGGDERGKYAAQFNNNRKEVVRAIAGIVKDVLDGEDNCGLLVIGGDTLLEIAKQVYCGTIRPQVELETGVPLSMAQNRSGENNIIITKSGGFGRPDVLERIFMHLRGGKL